MIYKFNYSKLSNLVLSLMLMFLIACGGGPDSDEKQDDNSEDQTEETSNESSDSAETESSDEEENSSSESSDEEAETINYKELQNYLPQSVKGYEADGEPSGQQFAIPNASYSMAEASFKKGDDELKIVIGDYIIAKTQLTMASAAWTMSLRMMNPKLVV